MIATINPTIPPAALGSLAGQMKQMQALLRSSAWGTGQFHTRWFALSAAYDPDLVSHARARKCSRVSVRWRLDSMAAG